MSITKRLRHHADPVQSPLGWPSALMLEAADEIERLDAEVTRLRDGIRKFLDEGVQETSGPYGQHKNNQCKHSRFGSEGCDACSEEFFDHLLRDDKV